MRNHVPADLANVVFVVQFQLKGALNQDRATFGPFLTYDDAEEYLATLPVARDCEHKYIDTLVAPTRENAVNAATLNYLSDDQSQEKFA